MPGKITDRFTICSLVILFFSTLNSFAQDSSFARLAVTTSRGKYKEQVKQDSTRRMIELHSLIPELVYDLRYSGSNNFMHRPMYPKGSSITFLRLPAAKALLEVQKQLNEKGLGLKIFDAYRPYSVTVKFWELVRDERYVANPAKGSGHNRGIAVDLTVINLTNGKELDMGTGFDNFSDTAHQTFTRLPTEVLQNRKLLRSAMEKNGFEALETEWWHYFLSGGDRFEILDIDFKKLKLR